MKDIQIYRRVLDLLFRKFSIIESMRKLPAKANCLTEFVASDDLVNTGVLLGCRSEPQERSSFFVFFNEDTFPRDNHHVISGRRKNQRKSQLKNILIRNSRCRNPLIAISQNLHQLCFSFCYKFDFFFFFFEELD